METPRSAQAVAAALFAAGLAAILVTIFSAGSVAAQSDSRTVSALGRLEPRGGVLRLSGPSLPVVVIAELHVEEGQMLAKGDLIARLDSHARELADIDRAQAELDDAKRELARSEKLQAGRAASMVAREEAEIGLKVARANLAGAQAELALTEVRSPIDGQVLAIHTRGGERVGADGILELGRTGQMYAVAEVYETDIGRVKAGQRATITSPALAKAVKGEVERVGLMVAKNDVLGTDPVAKTDARIVEVDIRLDDVGDASALTYLQVKVEIEP